MGVSDTILTPIYKKLILPHGETALLGFQNNKLFSGDLYDLGLNNWNINSDWQLDKKYDTIISLRCPYFSKDPQDFIKRCSEHLRDDGVLYLDWGLGDHWRFKDYKIGWVKNNEHEYAYGENNYLWSCVWSDKFLKDKEYKLFCQKQSNYGPSNISVGTDLKTKDDIKLSLTGLWFRMNDKIQRLKQLVVLGQPDEVGEPIQDTFQDLSVYGIIAQIVQNKKWSK